MFVSLLLSFIFSVTCPTDGNESCTGYLEFHWQSEDGELRTNSFELQYYRAFPPKKFRYLRKEQPFLYRIGGTCCWMLYEKRRKKGEAVYLQPGEHYPNGIPKIRSLEKIVCDIKL